MPTVAEGCHTWVCFALNAASVFSRNFLNLSGTYFFDDVHVIIFGRLAGWIEIRGSLRRFAYIF